MPCAARDGIFSHAMDTFLEHLYRFWPDLLDRTDGPMAFRFLLQPTMALLVALRDGVMDARLGRIPYLQFLMVETDPVARRAAWRGGLRAVGRILLLGVAMDVIYQFKVFGGFRYPLQTLAIAALLALVPYVLFRGPTSRIVRRLHRPG